MASRDFIVFFVNEQRHQISGQACYQTLSDFLRYQQSLTGTKVVCAEGDCGACTVLVASVHELSAAGKFVFKSINSCIAPLFSLDGCQIVTVEGLGKTSIMHPVQESMAKNFGSQCGFCTPGFVCSMAALVEDSIIEKKTITEKRCKNYLTGNLCRCTGYDPIIKAALDIDLKKVPTQQSIFSQKNKIDDLKKNVKKTAIIQFKNSRLILPATLKQALQFKNKIKDLQVVAGATDIGVAVNKGRTQYNNVMSLQNISSLWKIKKNKTSLQIFSRVTLSQLQKFIESNQHEFSNMLHIFASPQIKNSGTLIGNVVNASPISDTIPYLLVADAQIEVQSFNKKRNIPIDSFFLGYKKLNLKKNEIVTSIFIPIKKEKQLYKLYKVSLRKDLDISAVTMATRFQLNKNKIEDVRIAFGGVGPTVYRIKKIEDEWIGESLSTQLFKNASNRIGDFVKPLSDVRGSKEYRQVLCKNLFLKLAEEVQESEGFC